MHSKLQMGTIQIEETSNEIISASNVAMFYNLSKTLQNQAKITRDSIAVNFANGHE